ncbi:MAG: hypothetical protein JXR76_08770 [Deltaproteobacteria bacterium]|nr:hypothetical protein [Deltaproteobacteria bacterium]
MWRKILINAVLFISLPLLFAVCEPAGDESEQVMLPVTSNVTGIKPCVNDLGWNITVTRFEVSFKNLEFTTEGDAHAGLLQQISDFIIPSAMAHPGHLAGGEVIGELPGAFVVDFAAAAPVNMGSGVFLEGRYNGMNLYFVRATAGADGSTTDPIVGHTAYIEGVAQKDAVQIPFHITLDIENNLQMVGGVIDLTVNENTATTVGIQLLTIDPFENDTIFDGVDFSAVSIDNAGVAVIQPGQNAHNFMMKDLITHDQWMVITN